MADHYAPDLDDVDYDFNGADFHIPAATAQAASATADVLARAARQPKADRPASGRAKHRIDPTVKWDFYGCIMADRALTPGAIRVAYFLLDRYNHDTGECFPGIETLMTDTGLGRTAVLDALHGADKGRTTGLISREWFTVRKRRNQSNRYTPNLAKVGLTGREGERLAGFGKLNAEKSELPDPASRGSGYSEIRTPDIRKSEHGESGNPNPNPGNITQGRITQEAPGGGDESASRSVSINGRVGRASARPRVFDEEWVQIRDGYPGQTNGDKWKGLFINKRKAGVPFEELMAGVEMYRRYINATGGDIAPMFIAKWLSDEVWKKDRTAVVEILEKGRSGGSDNPNTRPTPEVG